MKRHEWEKGRKDLVNDFTEQEQCYKCGLYRFRALGIWMYSKEKTTNDNSLVDTISNKGCS